MVVNVNEDITRRRLEELLNNYDCCKCEKCMGDMMAIVLNNLKPAYVNTNKGILFKRVNSMLPQSATDLDIEILKAITLVSANPKH